MSKTVEHVNPNTKFFSREDLDGSAAARIQPCDVLLDIGTGIQPRNYVKANTYVCVEPYGEYVEALRTAISKLPHPGGYIVMQADWKNSLAVLPDQSVDVVLLIDVIEHLDKADGEALLKETIRKARRQVVLFTPFGYVQQHTNPDGTDAWGLHGESWQEHRSGWYPTDFDHSWETFVCTDYHRTDNLGRPLPKAEGAFWAIKTIERAENPKIYFDDVQRLETDKKNLLQKYHLLEGSLLEAQTRLNRIEKTPAYAAYRWLKSIFR